MHTSKVDIVMWAKNGAKYLESCLMSIEKQNIPVNQKIFIDDSSTDESANIATGFGWTVKNNVKGGISNAFVQALNCVETDWFCSFEQDIILCDGWWKKIKEYMNVPNMAVVQGNRIADNKFLRYADPPDTAPRNRVQKGNIPEYFWSIDNNIFRTEFLRKFDLESNINPITLDRYIREKVMSLGYIWFVDVGLISCHKRTSTKEYVDKLENYVICTMKNNTETQRSDTLKTNIKRLIECPIIMIQLSIENHYPMILLSYPYMYLNYIKFYLKDRRKWK